MNRITVTYYPPEYDKSGQVIAQERFHTVVGGKVPWPMSRTVGFISRVQVELLDGVHGVHGASAELPTTGVVYNKLVIEFDSVSGNMTWSSDPHISSDLLVGTLEVLKQTLVGAIMHQAMVAKQRDQVSDLLGPDGIPMRR